MSHTFEEAAELVHVEAVFAGRRYRADDKKQKPVWPNSPIFQKLLAERAAGRLRAFEVTPQTDVAEPNDE